MDKKLRPLVGLLLVAAVLVIVWLLLGEQLNRPDQTESTSETWVAEFEPKGATTDYLVSFSIGELNDSQTPDQAVRASGFNEVSCSTAEAGRRTSCQGHATLGTEMLTVTLSAPDLIVDDVEVARQVRQAPFDGGWISRLFLVILLLTPVFWFVHRWEALSQWMLIGFSFIALGALQFSFALPLIGFLLASFWLGRRYRESENRSARIILTWLTVTTVVLLIFKNFKALFFLPFEEYQALSLVLPLGTSYFLIRLLDLELRWHRGQLADLNLRRYLVYLFFPGTLVAGPIEMVDQFFGQRLERIGSDDIVEGAMRVTMGVAKKLVVVDLFLGNLLFGSGLWSSVITGSGTSFDAVKFCVAAYLLAYLDFSAYSDIAIGVSRLLGYRICENFAWPIFASDVAEFWRRWHMSLSNWAFRNIFFTTLVATGSRTVSLFAALIGIGLWHELSLSWVTWGIYHGAGLAVLAALPKKGWIPKNWFGKGLGMVATNLFVAAGFAFVTVPDYSLAWSIFLQFVTAPFQIL